MKIKEILEITKGIMISGNENDECENFKIDSREIKQGDTFVSVGEGKINNIDYIRTAIKNGAKNCIVYNKEPIIKDENVNIIGVEDTQTALQQMATYERSKHNIPVVAITGSVGKTSTKDMVASVLSMKYKVLKTQGNMNNELGLPLTILSIKDEDAICVEMGMNHFGEISRLTNIAKPTVAIVTNVGTAHIGNLGSRENILKAKLEILEGLQENTVIINNDNDLLGEWAKNDTKYNKITYGIENKSSFMANEIQSYEDKSIYNLIEEKITTIKNEQSEETKDIQVTVPVGGEHFVLNSLCAIAVGTYFEIPRDKILQGISKFELTKKRMEINTAKNGATVINDTYNANYDSMKAGILYLQNINNKRKIAILGDMLELGDYAEELHSAVGKEIKDIDILITVGELSKNIAKNAKAKEIYQYTNNGDAIAKIKEIMTPNDIILVKASNSMKFIEIVDAITKE